MKKSVIITTSIAVFGMSGFAMAKPGKGEGFRKAMLEKYDEDGDGQLSDEEKKAAREAWVGKMKEKIDTDGDGEVSDEEKQAFREKFGKRRGGHKGRKGSKKGRGDFKAKLLEKFDSDGNGELSDEEKAEAKEAMKAKHEEFKACLLYTSPSPRDKRQSRMPSSA